MREPTANAERVRVRVTSVRRRGAESALAAASALFLAAKRPNTAEPLPDIAAYDAPSLPRRRTRRPISGCRFVTGGSRSFHISGNILPSEARRPRADVAAPEEAPAAPSNQP